METQLSGFDFFLRVDMREVVDCTVFLKLHLLYTFNLKRHLFHFFTVAYLGVFKYVHVLYLLL